MEKQRSVLLTTTVLSMTAATLKPVAQVPMWCTAPKVANYVIPQLGNLGADEEIIDANFSVNVEAVNDFWLTETCRST